MNKKNNYTKTLANEALNGLSLYLVGPHVVPQKKYVDGKVTDEITGYQVWCATREDNPFKIKFNAEDKPDLRELEIGDEVIFENLEAIQINNKIYFRATGIEKA
ncbi:hypothetical protein GMA11_08075 [Granulicatella sp. zg-ZJ]|uniref:hypothetical protein n=1 Tax=unclassified Granulicatella TaxID=2630493 RepID=UPI0013BF0735|nr:MULTISPECIES: hypothetical protein [unclassified Granulicatella]MBS4751156.1 hypothetical protein [Carnobacteriaceae bacterium zg-ZUI78]NEW63335.1 hypothetical protein [Granulicatella sp. zg-ZJ]NEW66934.1 hypothetical protein [Granulicatella sp. zg-84]QMI85895.1 hypothetical protein H1220_00540 [Carnobacteriaceae bacterium zg-84]